MIGLIRLAIVGFMVLSIVYFVLRIYFRSLETERLEKLWEENGHTGERDAFVAKGLSDYEGSLRRKLIWLVYILPTILVAALIYVNNFM